MSGYSEGEALKAPSRDNLVSNVITRKAYSKYKVIISGNHIETYESEHPFIITEDKFSVEGYLGETTSTIDKEYENYCNMVYRYLAGSSRSEEYKKRNAIRAKNKIRRLIQQNFLKKSKFITLTFADTQEFDIKSINDCNVKLQGFIRKLRLETKDDLKYVSVIEFQDKNGRGAVHYHIICNADYIELSTLNRIWPHGWCTISQIKNDPAVGSYVSKYITKDIFDTRFLGCRRFYTSVNLTLPRTIYGAIAEALAIKLSREFRGNARIHTQYESEYQGTISYYDYDFSGEEVNFFHDT